MDDLITAGPGTAGCVLAGRLSRSGRLRVLLVKAGDDPTNRFVKVPAAVTKLFKSDVDWAFETAPLAAAGGRRIFTPRGKMLGGSSNMNAQIHQWRHPADFEEWEAAGAAGWGWAEVAAECKAQEKWLGDDPEGVRGREGPMVISPNSHALPLSKAFVEAARAAGLGGMPRCNGMAYEGAWLVELAHRKGQRFSAHGAYLKPALGRANLRVLRHARVTRINFENGLKTAGRDGESGRREGISRGWGSRPGRGGFWDASDPHVVRHRGCRSSEGFRD